METLKVTMHSLELRNHPESSKRTVRVSFDEPIQLEPGQFLEFDYLDWWKSEGLSV